MSVDDAMRDHFWRRPGWATHRPYLTFHILPGPQILPQVRAVQARLRAVENLAPVAPHRLHVTGPGVGFADTLPKRQVGALIEAAAEAAGDIEAFAAPVGAPVVHAEAVFLEVTSPRLVGLRRILREAMRTVRIKPPGDDDEDYRPHVSVAYATGGGSQERVRSVLAGLPSTGPSIRVDAVHLLALVMEQRGYGWEVVARIPLASPPVTS